MEKTDPFLEDLIEKIKSYCDVDAIYLYGSRAKNTAHDKSDWDIAVLYHEFEHTLLERYARPQLLEAYLQKEFKMYDLISIVDLEIVPVPLQYNIISGKKLYDRGIPHVRRVENSIISKLELDYLS